MPSSQCWHVCNARTNSFRLRGGTRTAKKYPADNKAKGSPSVMIISGRQSQWQRQDLEEIHCYQKFTKLLIRKKPFYMRAREILQGKKADFHMTSGAIRVLQEALEVFLVDLFDDPDLCTIYTKHLHQRHTVCSVNPEETTSGTSDRRSKWCLLTLSFYCLLLYIW